MDVRPITETRSWQFERREHACFGISPFNSFFSEPRIEALAEWGLREFESIHFFVPDGPAAFTLEALGYTPEKAAWKARRQGQYTINKILRALKNLAVSDISACNMILDWSRLSDNERYLDLYQKTKTLFESDETFRNQCLEASKWVLEKRTEDLTEAMLRSAVRYFLAEIPLFADTAGIVGVRSSSFCYHQTIPFLEKLYKQELSFPVVKHQAYLVITDATFKQPVGTMESQ